MIGSPVQGLGIVVQATGRTPYILLFPSLPRSVARYHTRFFVPCITRYGDMDAVRRRVLEHALLSML